MPRYIRIDETSLFRSKVFLVFIFLASVLFSLPYLLIFSPQNVQAYAYRESSYAYIAHKETEGLSDPADILLELFDYVSFNLTVSAYYRVVDENPLNDLVRGVAWCDQQAFVLMTLLDKKNLSSRERDVRGHTIAEVLIDEEWNLVDPMFGVIFHRKEDKRLATLQDLVASDGAAVVSGKIEASRVYNPQWLGDYVKLYTPTEGRWENGIGPPLREWHPKGRIRSSIDLIIDTARRIYGERYIFWYQDRYLQTKDDLADPGQKWFRHYLEKPNDQAYRTYYKARNYHLYGRYALALRYYDTVITAFPESSWSAESRYYKGVAYLEQGRYQQAIDQFTKVIANPDGPRLIEAFHKLGLVYEKLGDTDEAIKYYRRSLSSYCDSAVRLCRLEKTCLGDLP